MRTANNDGAFARIDINSLDVFPMHLCRYILPWKPPMPEDTLRRVPFEIAVQDHFPEEFTANMLNMISAFDILADKTSFPPTFTFALAFVRYLLHRLSLSSSLDTDTKSAVVLALHNVQSYVKFKDLPDDQVVALSDLVEYVVIHSLVFKLGPEWTGPQISLVKLYSAMVGVSSLHRPRYSPRHTFWPALRPLVEFLINQYDAPHHHIWSEHAPFDIMCDILGFGLEHGVQTVYDVFLETRCLDVFGDHSLRPSLIRVINGYVAGLAASHASIDSQRHLDYLHEPGNLFLACCILATNGWNAFSGKPRMIEKIPARLSGEICRDVRALASLRPSDPSWDPCRRKLRDLLQNDEREFFVKQQKWSMCGFKVLKPEAIDEAKNNIRLALDELDGFISDSKNMNLPFSMHRHESMALRFLGGICQYLQYPRRRERDEVQV
ncbi:hypothetical protein IW262DRAFT_1363508 [Armillaria fumosa]|nr:hypothetical protein IW262DRAFT_1363508 [Armillaria fumosa]